MKNISLVTAFALSFSWTAKTSYEYKEFGYYPYNYHIVDDLQNLNSFSKQDQREIIISSKSLEPKTQFDFVPLTPHEKNHHFIATDPEITWLGDNTRTHCEAVKFIHEATKYIKDRFVLLRKNALNLLDEIEFVENQNPEKNKLEDLEKQYDDTIAEMSHISGMLASSYDSYLYEYDRLATYTFAHSVYLQRELFFSNNYIEGAVRVSKVSFGNHPFIDIETDLVGFANFVSEAEVGEDHIISVKRKLTPLEACLGDLKVSLVGSIKIKRKSFLNLPPFWSDIPEDELSPQDPWPIDDFPSGLPPICPPLPRPRLSQSAPNLKNFNLSFWSETNSNSGKFSPSFP